MTDTIIDVSHIAKTYYTEAGSLPVLHDVNLTVQRGEFIAIMGASGSGKSTFMNLLGCLDGANQGEYILAGQAISSLTKDQLAHLRNKVIGFVFQGFNLLSRTSLVDNVALPLVYAGVSKAQRQQRALAMLDKVGLLRFAQQRPNQISGGQQQRVAIARALVNQPTLLLADEPTGNLDSKTSHDVMSLFCQLNDEGITIMLVTHEVDIAAYAKRLVVFSDGAIIEDKAVSKRSWPC